MNAIRADGFCIFRLFSLVSVTLSSRRLRNSSVRKRRVRRGFVSNWFFPFSSSLSLSIFLCFYVLLLFHPKRGEIRGKADCTSSDKKIGKWNLHSSARISDQWKMWRHGPTIRAAYLLLCFVLFLSSWEMFTQLISPASSLLVAQVVKVATSSNCSKM